MSFVGNRLAFFFTISLLLSGAAQAMDHKDSPTPEESKTTPLTLSPILLERQPTLDFSSCGLNDDDACSLAKASKNMKAAQINLNHNHIGNKGIKALAPVFKTMPLTHLNLYGNPIEDEGFSDLFTALKEKKSLVHMDIRSTKLGKTGAHMLVDVLESNPSLTYYGTLNKEIVQDILDEKIDKAGVLKLHILIKRLTVLGFTPGSIDDEGACKFAELMKDSQISNLDLGQQCIGNKGIKALAPVFKTMPLAHLSLVSNPIEDEGISDLFSALKGKKSLVNININNIKLGESGIHKLVELLESNPSLTYHLNMSSISKDMRMKLLTFTKETEK